MAVHHENNDTEEKITEASSASIVEYSIDENSNFETNLLSKMENTKVQRKRSSLSSLSSLQQRKVSGEFSLESVRSRSGRTRVRNKGSAMSLIEARIKNPTVCLFINLMYDKLTVSILVLDY